MQKRPYGRTGAAYNLLAMEQEEEEKTANQPLLDLKTFSMKRCKAVDNLAVEADGKENKRPTNEGQDAQPPKVKMAKENLTPTLKRPLLR